MIETIEDPEFKKLLSIGHAFFTRKGGFSVTNEPLLSSTDDAALRRDKKTLFSKS